MEQHTPGKTENLIISLDDETELRAVQIDDAEELFSLIDRNREHLRQWMPWMTAHYSIDDARQFLARTSAEFAARTSVTTIIRHNGAVCGVIGLHPIDRLHDSTSVGYWIDAGHQGRGIVTAACRAIVTHGFEEFGLHRIEIRCGTWNHRSSGIPRRLGFVEEGILREAERVDDKWLDLRVFSMLSHDWMK